MVFAGNLRTPNALQIKNTQKYDIQRSILQHSFVPAQAKPPQVASVERLVTITSDCTSRLQYLTLLTFHFSLVVHYIHGELAIRFDTVR